MRASIAARPNRAAALGAVLGAFATGCTSIPEGRSAVDTVHIKNVQAASEEELKDKLATAESPKFMGLFRGLVYDYEIFDAATLQRDLARVERFYRGHGFLEAHARAGRVIQTSPNHVRVEIVVDEGPPTLDRAVRIEGLESLPPSLAQTARSAVLDVLRPGARFDEGAYLTAKTALSRALTDNGYAYARVEVGAQADLAAHAIDYTFTVQPGPAAVFGPITIAIEREAGVSASPNDLDLGPLRRAMDLHPGHPYSTAAIDAATQALLDLEVLASVQIVPALADPPAREVPLTVKVQPAKLHAVRAGGGVEFDDIKTDLHALIGWEDHDFFGKLRDFSVELRPGVVAYPLRADNIHAPTDWLVWERFRVQLRQPGFLEPHTTAFVRPEMNVFPMLVTIDPAPSQPVLGYIEPKLVVGADRRFGKHLLVTVQENLQGEVPFHYTTQYLATPLPPVFLSVPEIVATLDFRDDAVHPHSGFYLANDLQVAGGPYGIFGGSARDVRVQPEARGYVPIARGVTLAARTSVGFLFASDYGDYVQHHLGAPLSPNPNSSDRLYENVDRDIEITLFRGFFSGGPGVNRGFPLRGIAPHGTIPFLSPATVASQGVACIPGQPLAGTSQCSSPIGGFSLWEASVELRFDVSGPLGVAVFCDSGDVAAAQATLRFDHLHLSCGAGARYDTPVGPIRLDIGYRIDPLQVLGYSSPAANPDPTEGQQPGLFGNVPLAIAFGIGETY
jgi:outer membrane protein insertion porin family/translocation and assembly module TamA